VTGMPLEVLKATMSLQVHAQGCVAMPTAGVHQAIACQAVQQLLA
jgi:hypothetical protein